MNKFDNRSKGDMLVTTFPQGGGAEEHQQGPESFAAGIDNVMPDVFHHINVRVELFDDELINSLEVLCDGGVYLMHRVWLRMKSASAC